jgi:putative membrane protein
MMKNLLVGAGLATALVFAAPAAWAQSKAGQDKAGQAFLKKAIEANFAEVEMGKLAQQKGASEDVKSFGKMLQDDHSKANDKAMSLAKDMGMTPPTGPNAKQKAEYDRMAKMSGDKFDKAFAKHMVADHKKDIKEFQKEAKKNDKPSGFANEVLPDLQKHLQTAQQIDGKGKTTGSH